MFLSGIWRYYKDTHLSSADDSGQQEMEFESYSVRSQKKLWRRVLNTGGKGP